MFAAPSANNLQKLADALKSDTIKNIQSYTEVKALNKVTHTTGLFGSTTVVDNITADTYIRLDTWKKYQDVVNAVTLLDTVMKSTNEYAKASFTSDSDARASTNYGWLKDAVQNDLVNGGYLTSKDLSDYNIPSFLAMVYRNEPDFCQRVDANGNNTDSNKSPDWVKINLYISTEDVVGYASSKSSYTEIEDFATEMRYTLPMKEYSYSTGSGFRKKTYFYSAVQVNQAGYEITYGATKNNTTLRASLNTFAAELAKVSGMLGYSLKDLVEYAKSNDLETLYTTYETAYNTVLAVLNNNKALVKQLFADEKGLSDQFIANCKSAVAIESSVVAADKWTDFVKNHPDYGTYKYHKFDGMVDQLRADYEAFKPTYETITGLNKDTIGFLESELGYKFDFEYFTNFTDNVKVYDLQKIADDAEKLYNDYKDNYEELPDAEQYRGVHSAFRMD